MSERYCIMNKDKVIAIFAKLPPDNISDNCALEFVWQSGQLPFGLRDIDSWIENRKSSSHNKSLIYAMRCLGCFDRDDFLRFTHAVSLNDTFWIKSEDEGTCWEDVSPYKNEFNERVSEFVLGTSEDYPILSAANAPELCSEGSYRKCFIRENGLNKYNNSIYVCKRGSEKHDGIEAYCEAMSSELAKAVSDRAVNYELTNQFGVTVSKCGLFTDEKTGFTPYKSAMPDSGIRTLADNFYFFRSRLLEQEFREMIVIDSLCFNTDRHKGNYGWLFDTDTLEIKGFAPIFDFNRTLFHNADESRLNSDSYEQLQNIGLPRTGGSFILSGQLMMNDIIRERVEKLRDFSFSFRGNGEFPEKRVELLERVVRRHAEELLSGKDVSESIEDISSQKRDASVPEFTKEQIQLSKKALHELCASGDTTVKCPKCGKKPLYYISPRGERVGAKCECSYIADMEINL